MPTTPESSYERAGRQHVAELLADTLLAAGHGRPPDVLSLSPEEWGVAVVAASALSHVRAALHPGYKPWTPKADYRPSTATQALTWSLCRWRTGEATLKVVDPFDGLPD